MSRIDIRHPHSLPKAKARKAVEDVAKKLGVAPDEEVTQFYRVRAVDNIPITIHDSYLPTKYLGNISEKLLREKVSLYNVLREDYGIVIQSGLDQITAEIADEEVARILGINQGDPVLHMERTAYDQNNMIIEYSSVLYRGDRYTHTIVTKRNDT